MHRTSSRPWSIRGRVISGRGIARKLGSPTLNLPLRDPGVPYGIFVGLAVIGKRAYPAVIHVGPRPAIHDRKPIIEAHLLTPPPRLISGRVQVLCVHRLRAVRNFRTLTALRRQIQMDIQQANKWWGL